MCFRDFVPHGKTGREKFGRKGRTRQVEGRSLAVRHKGQKTAPKLVIALLGTALLACAPVVDNRGYVFDEGWLKLQKNSVTMQHAAAGMLGSPSMRSSINGEALYYIHSVIVTRIYRAPIETDRKVMALYFNADKVLQDYAVYGLRDGLIVPIVPRTTQSQGRELSLSSRYLAILAALTATRLPNSKNRQ